MDNPSSTLSLLFPSQEIDQPIKGPPSQSQRSREAEQWLRTVLRGTDIVSNWSRTSHWGPMYEWCQQLE